MTKNKLKEQFSLECTELDSNGRTVVKGTPMDIINWIANKFCLSDVKNSHYQYCDKDFENGMKYKILTENDLEKLGFISVKNDTYINKKQWLLQVSNHYINVENDQIINRDGTWFDAIGTWNFHKNGEMVVNTLCRGNYVCGGINTVEELLFLFYALTGNKLEFKD